MELESVLKFLKDKCDGTEPESFRRIIMAVEYAIKARNADRAKISELTEAIVSRFVQDNQPVKYM